MTSHTLISNLGRKALTATAVPRRPLFLPASRCSIHSSVPRSSKEANAKQLPAAVASKDKAVKAKSAGMATLAGLDAVLTGDVMAEGSKQSTRKQRRTSSTNYRFLAGAALALFSINHYFNHLELVPATGRWRYMRMDKQEEDEIADRILGKSIKSYVWSNKLLPDDDPRSQLVMQIFDRILGALQPSDYSLIDFDKTDWTVGIVEDPSVANLMMAGNGRVVVFTGLLEVCANEDELAFTLAHEIAHQLLRHIPEEFSSISVYLPLMKLLNWCGATSAAERIHRLILSWRRSRQREYEADAIGLQLMSQACYDPRKAHLIWAKLDQDHTLPLYESVMKDLFPNRQTTHPHSYLREKPTIKQLPRALKIRKRAGCPALADVEEFKVVAKGL